jgi:uncharacterized protein (TIGR03437 family)
MSFLRRRAYFLIAAVVMISANALCQTMVVSQNWLPAASESGPLRITFSNIPPATYQLFTQGSIAVRWNGRLLSARTIPASLFDNPAAIILEFTVPTELRVPGLTEFVLWDTNAQHPLPYRGTIPVIIPTPATVFEADPASDRVVAAIGEDGSAGGTGCHISVFALSTGVLTETIAVPEGQRVLAFTPDTKYAWIAQDEAEGRLARINIASGQIDQQIQITAGRPPYLLTAEVYRRDPRLLMVTFYVAPFSLTPFSETQAYSNGNLLPNATRILARSPFRIDDRGRVLMSLGQACELNATDGFIRCVDLMPGVSFAAVWKNKGFTFDRVFDLTTGNTLLQLGSQGTATYLSESNRVLFSNYESMLFADGDSLEIWASLKLGIQPDADGPRRLWAPDWLLMRTPQGILIGHIPQLAPAPLISAAAVVHAATGKPGPITAGEIITIFGQNLGPVGGSGAIPESGLRLATEVERTKVLFDGVAAAILYADAGQINVVVPETVQEGNPAGIQVVHYGIPSARVQAQVAASSPGIFGYTTQGKTYAAALNPDGQVQGPGTPLRRGSVVSLYTTGVGMGAGETADAIATRPAEVPVRPLITIGGKPAQVLYAGVSPGLTAGLTQLNVIIPADAPVGSAIEVVIASGNQKQGNVWVAIR